MASPAIDTRELAALRRRLNREVGPEARKALDRELKDVARGAATDAAALTPKRSGRLAASWRPSVTARGGVSIRNPRVYAAQHEYGRKVWLRRGLPYAAMVQPNPIGPVPMRVKRLPDGRMVNEAQYLIRRRAPGQTAAAARLEQSVPEIQAAMTRAIDRAL